MDKQYFIKLLHRYLDGDVTNEERQCIENYYNVFQNEPDVLNILSGEKKKKLENEIRGQVWENISRQEDENIKYLGIRNRIIQAVAAAVFIGIILSAFFLYNNRAKDKQPTNYVIEQSNNKPKADTNIVTATHKNDNRVIFLADGSVVFLSPGSVLNYPSTFDGKKKREVYLQGQAFFDIKHNAARPFIVHTGKVQTTVLGTAFNIKALPDEKDITITVSRGKVRVSDSHKILGTITPQQQITYNIKKEMSIVSKVNNEGYLDWKNSNLFIDNLTLAEAAKLLEGQYKVKIIFNDASLEEQRFTATFPKNEKLEQAIKSITEFNGLTYTINNDKIIIAK